jgi:threonine dehydrogenase-like Zn-dependent dehydrogenase
MMMKFAQAPAPHRIEIKEGPAPEPGDSEILVKVTLCGIDWPTFKHVIEGEDTVYPADGSNNLNLAHEASGVVVATGRNVKRFKAGDRVSYLGPGFQEYAVVKEDFAGKVPDGVDDLDLLGEPMAVMYHSALRSEPRPEQTVAVFGAGYMGLGIIHMLSRMGVQTIIAVERDEKRLSTAARMGAKHVVNPRSGNPAEAIKKLTGGSGVDLAVEATGSDGVLAHIHEAVKPCGTILFHGWFSGEKKVHLDQWHVQDLTLKFSHPAPHEIYGRLIEQVGREVAKGRFDLRPLVTHTIPFSNIENLEDVIKNSHDFIKGVVTL